MIYLDYAATSPVDPEVLDTFVKVNKNFFANTSSNHKIGFEAAQLELKARQQVANLFNVTSNEVLFTSGATESNNLAIKGVAFKYQNRGKHIITSLGEHASVLNSFKLLEEEFGFRVTYLSLNQEGKIDIEELKKALTDDTILVSIMAVNNEVGAINPIEEIGRILKKYPKLYFHVDATQAIGKVKINYQDVDLISMSAHKIGGFKGSGILIKKDKIDLMPLFNGGGQELGLRSGTTNYPYAVAASKALRIALERQEERYEYVKKLNEYLVKELKAIPGIEFNSPKDASPYILNFHVNKKGSVVSEALSNQEFYVSTQSACSSKKTSFSHVLVAMGKDMDVASNSLRVSLSYLTKKEELVAFIKTLKQILNSIK